MSNNNTSNNNLTTINTSPIYNYWANAGFIPNMVAMYGGLFILSLTGFCLNIMFVYLTKKSKLKTCYYFAFLPLIGAGLATSAQLCVGVDRLISVLFPFCMVMCSTGDNVTPEAGPFVYDEGLVIFFTEFACYVTICFDAFAIEYYIGFPTTCLYMIGFSSNLPVLVIFSTEYKTAFYKHLGWLFCIKPGQQRPVIVSMVRTLDQVQPRMRADTNTIGTQSNVINTRSRA
uniref:G-protein coupled receptors family 1 profile domain-containing protein n=1 Tax=Meloidogyne javanica TaxID=6303 RepID=A0A915N7C9_MELJA